MDIQTIEQQFGQLQNQSRQTVQALQTLGGKLQAAAQNGDQQAREWFLDLRELAISFKTEQDQMSNLLQAIHGFVANEAQAQGSSQGGYQGSYQGGQTQGNWGQQPGYGQTQQAGYTPSSPQGGFMPQAAQGGFVPQAAQGGFAPPPAQGGGGMLGSFLNSGFGRAIEMGAGFGIGDELISKIF